MGSDTCALVGNFFKDKISGGALLLPLKDKSKKMKLLFFSVSSNKSRRAGNVYSNATGAQR